MSLVVSDVLKDGSGAAVVGAPVLSWPIPEALTVSGNPATAPWPSATTSSTGAFTITLPDTSVTTPSTVLWAIRVDQTIYLGPPIAGTFTIAQLLGQAAPNTWTTTNGGNLPVSAAAGLGLGLSFGQVVVREIPGPQGIQGPPGSGSGSNTTINANGGTALAGAITLQQGTNVTLTENGQTITIAATAGSTPAATTTALGAVEIDHAPASGNPIALTEAGIALPSGMLSSTTPLADGTAAIGTSTLAARADHVHPAAASSGGGTDVILGVYPYQTWTVEPDAITTQVGFSAKYVYCFKIIVPTAFTCNTVSFDVEAAAATPTANENFIGLYNSSGTLVWGSAAGAMDTVFTASGLHAVSTGGVALSAGFYWVAFLQNCSTGPSLGSTGAKVAVLNAGLSAATLRSGYFGGSDTSLPASMTPASLSANGGGNYPWFALS